MGIRRWMIALAVGTSLMLTACVIRSGPGVSHDVPTNAGGQTSGSAIVVANNSSDVVCRVFISPHDDPNWGEDRLGSNTLNPGASFGLPVQQGSWDVQLTACDRTQVLAESRDVVVGADPTVLTYE